MSDSKFLNFLNRNSGPILTGVSILSFGVAIWRTYVSSPKIHDILEDHKEDWDDARTADERKRTTKRTIKAVAKEAWPIALSFGLGTTAEIFNVKKASNEIDKYALMWATEKSFNKRYRKEVQDEVGAEKEREIRDRSVLRCKEDREYQEGIKNLTVTDEDWIIYDSVSRQYIVTNKSKVLMALSKINMRNMSEHFVEYVDFLYEIGGDISKVPSDVTMIGWDLDDGVVEPVWTTDEMEGSGRPIGVLSFSVEPDRPRKH